MDINIFIKQPYERYPISMDYTGILGTDTISSCSVIGKDNKDNDVTNIITESPIIETNKVTVAVQNGVSGTRYKIIFRVETLSGNKYEDDVIMSVKD